MTSKLRLNDAEEAKIDEFVGRHRDQHYQKLTATFTVEFAPTGIGTCTKVSCSCGESLDASDYESW